VSEPSFHKSPIAHSLHRYLRAKADMCCHVCFFKFLYKNRRSSVQLLFRYVLPRLLFQIFIQKQTIMCAIVVQICAATSAFSNFHTKEDDHMYNCCSDMCYHVCFFKFLYKSRRSSVQLLFRYVLPRLLFQIFI